MPSSSSLSLPTASSQSENGERHSVGSAVCAATTYDELVVSNSNANSTSISSAVVADVMNTADTYEGVLISVFNFLSQQHQLRELTVVSKHFYNIVHYGDEEDATVRTRKGIEFQLIPLFELTPTKGAKITTFANNMHRHSLNNETIDKLQNYRLMRVNSVNMFIHCPNSLASRESVRKLRGIRMEGIRTIDTTLPLPTFSREPYIFLAIAHMDLPNLREIIFSNMADSNIIVRRFSQTFPLLETISICNSFECSSFDNDNYFLRGCLRDCNNLRSITMNDFDFYSRDMDQLADLTRHDNVFIFHDCFSKNTHLERISIRGIRYSTFAPPATNHKIPQNALIKLVRNAPASLKWFRSDLTIDNIDMLQTERNELGKSKIELLN